MTENTAFRDWLKSLPGYKEPTIIERAMRRGLFKDPSGNLSQGYSTLPISEEYLPIIGEAAKRVLSGKKLDVY